MAVKKYICRYLNYQILRGDARPIRFNQSFYATSDPEEQKVIEKSRDYGVLIFPAEGGVDPTSKPDNEIQALKAELEEKQKLIQELKAQLEENNKRRIKKN